MYLISYDLSNDRLRNKVAKQLENYGKRVQYSVFECNLTTNQIKELYAKLADIMQEEENGSIRFYYLCKSCLTKQCAIGITEKQEDPDGLIVI